MFTHANLKLTQKIGVAILLGQEEKALKLLSQPVDIHLKYEDEKGKKVSLLYISITAPTTHQTIIEKLLELGADPNEAVHTPGFTPCVSLPSFRVWHIAALMCRAEIVQLFLEKCVDHLNFETTKYFKITELLNPSKHKKIQSLYKEAFLECEMNQMNAWKTKDPARFEDTILDLLDTFKQIHDASSPKSKEEAKLHLQFIFYQADKSEKTFLGMIAALCLDEDFDDMRTRVALAINTVKMMRNLFKGNSEAHKNIGLLIEQYSPKTHACCFSF